MTENVMTQAARQRKRKFQAVLAGGLVLGIGAAVTLAAWNDSEFAEGIFTTGEFNLEGSTDGPEEGFAEHPTEAEAAELEFEADNLVPGETVYAPFHLRLDAATTVDGSIPATVTADSQGGVSLTSEGDNSDFFAFELYSTADCSATGIGEIAPIAEAGTLTGGDVGLTGALDLESNAAGTVGDTVSLCFVVTADDDDLLEGAETTATWEFQAVSDDA